MEQKKEISSLLGGIASVGVASGLMMNVLGGMNKMFGTDEKTPQKLAEEMMAGAIRGILEHFDWKLDEEKRTIVKLKEELDEEKRTIENLKEQVEILEGLLAKAKEKRTSKEEKKST